MSLLPNTVGIRRTVTRRSMTFGLASLAITGVSLIRNAAAAIDVAAIPLPSLAATPATLSNDTIEVRLAPGLGNEWCVYNGQLSADSLARIGDVSIASVSNETGEGVVVIHWDRDGHRVGPVSLGPDAISDAFNEMSVAGVWEAHVSGSEVDAPQRVTLKVEFRNA